MSNKLVYYRYKLRDDGKAPADRVGVGGHNLSTTEWKISPHKLETLNPHLRSLNNPDGWVEMQEFDPYTEEVYGAPATKVPEKAYNRDQLAVMKRDELVEIAKSLALETYNAKADMLVNKIIDAQAKFQVGKKDEQPAQEPAV